MAKGPNEPCGSKCRDGHACRNRVTFRKRNGNYRCRMHGGLSTGPKTAEGKARVMENLKRGWLRDRKAVRQTPCCACAKKFLY